MFEAWMTICLAKEKDEKWLKQILPSPQALLKNFPSLCLRFGKLGGKICRKMFKNLREIFSGALFDEIYAHCG